MIIKYCIFEIPGQNWGYFGLAVSSKGLLRSHLPFSCEKSVKSHLLKGLNQPKYEKNLLNPLKEQIIAYFKGSYNNFDGKIALDLAEFSGFARSVLLACRKIKFGQTATYSDLAGELKKPNAARATGNALAQNPIPLIIPCHRVIKIDGSIGGFSATGGPDMKSKLLRHEHNIITTSKTH